MEEVLIPLYLHHRYQVEAAASAIGGMHYIYAMRGDNRQAVRAVPATEQRAALTALTATLRPSVLRLPETVVKQLPPRPMGWDRTRELFPRYTGQMFDIITPAVVAADWTIANILDDQRAARVVQQHAVDNSIPTLDEVIDGVVQATFRATAADDYEREIKRAIERVAVEHLIRLSTTAGMPQVRAIATSRLQRIIADAGRGASSDDAAQSSIGTVRNAYCAGRASRRAYWRCHDGVAAPRVRVRRSLAWAGSTW
jgi:hypothetical protein